MSKNVSEILNASMSKIRDMVDANTVVGTPITVSEKVTLIPVSKVTFGVASGGTDLAAKAPASSGTFGGGAGCGVKIMPVAVIAVQDDRVRLLPIDEPAGTAAERLVEMLPGLVDKITELLPGHKEDVSDI